MLIPSLDSYFWVVKKPKTLKKLLKLRFLDNFSGGRRGGMRPRRLIWNYYTLLSYISSGRGAPISLKVATKASLKGKKTLKTLIFRLLF